MFARFAVTLNHFPVGRGAPPESPPPPESPRPPESPPPTVPASPVGTGAVEIRITQPTPSTATSAPHRSRRATNVRKERGRPPSNGGVYMVRSLSSSVRSHVQVALLKKEDHPIEGLPVIPCLRKTNMDAMTPGLLENPEEPVQIVPIHLHHGLCKRSTLE